MGVRKHQVRGKTYWMIDEWLGRPDGTQFRFRQRQIPTKEQALSLVAKKKAEAFEGRFFDRRKESTFRVRDAWELYAPISRRDNDSWLRVSAHGDHRKRGKPITENGGWRSPKTASRSPKTASRSPVRPGLEAGRGVTVTAT